MTASTDDPEPARAAARAGAKFLDCDSMPWRPFDEAPGVAFRVLKTHRPGNGATLMLRFDPHSAYPAHRHPAGEEYYVLAGELIDGPTRYGPGTYVWHPPGSAHAPRSERGATILVFVPGGIELLADTGDRTVAELPRRGPTEQRRRSD